jgi:hypothetical protein
MNALTGWNPRPKDGDSNPTARASNVGSTYIVIYLKLKFYSLNLLSSSNVQVCESSIESLADLERKIDSITKTLSKPYFNKILNDLLKFNPANAKTIVDYILIEQIEINIKDSTKESKIKTLVWLSNFNNNKSFTELTKQDTSIHNSNRLLVNSFFNYFKRELMIKLKALYCIL